MPANGPDATPPSPIAAGGVLLHIGPPKTGSTAVQNALHGQRDELARHGVRYAGDGIRPQEAGWAALGIQGAVGRRTPRIEKWHALVGEVREHPDVRVCVSSEDFARASPEAAARIVTDLGADRVHLVHVVRRYDRLLPSLWQERVKARLTSPYEVWLAEVLAEGPSAGFEWRNLRTPHEVSGILERWGAVLPADRITLICSDDSDRRLIPGTFEKLLGLPDGLLSRGDLTTSNRSLTGNEAELLRRVNEAAAREKWSPQEYLYLCQLGIARSFRLSDPGAGDQRIPSLPDWARARAAALSRQQVEAVRTSGVQVIGDPDRLLVDESSEDDDAAAPVTSVDLDTAVTAVLGAIHGTKRLEGSPYRTVAVPAKKPRRRRPAHDQRPAAQLSSRQLLRIIAVRAKRRLRHR